jgi:hypothetical protein
MTHPPTVNDAGPVASTPAGPASLAAVKTLLRLTTTADDDLIAAAVAGVNAWVARLPWATDTDPDTGAVSWTADVTYGANLLGGRLYRRRNSPAGVEAFSDIGGAVYVQRNDPDIAMMLGIGTYARPVVG